MEEPLTNLVENVLLEYVLVEGVVEDVVERVLLRYAVEQLNAKTKIEKVLKEVVKIPE